MAALMFLLFSAAVFGALVRYLLLAVASRDHRRQLPLPPGPRGWPILGNLPQLRANPHQTLAALSRTYGPLMKLRFGCIDVIVASSSSIASAFLKINDTNFSSRPPSSGAEHMGYKYQDLVFAPYGPRWRALRKICFTHLFSAKALDNFRLVREQEAAELVRSLLSPKRGGRSGEEVVAEEINVCVANSLARAMMGRRLFGEGLGKEAREFKQLVMELMTLAGVLNVGDFVPGLGWLDLQGVVARMKKVHRRYDAMLNNIIARHAEEQRDAAGREAADLLSVMIGLRGKAVDSESIISDVDIKALLLNLFSAGTDTTTITVEWALTELIHNPRLLCEVQQEIDSVVGRSRLVSDSDLSRLPFLQAVVKETFRLHPSTPLSLPHMASESCEIAGYHVPKGATLLVNIWAISRDPAFWPDPLQFRPTRFLPGGENAHVDLRGTDFDFIPFGAGRRICAGMSLGLRMVQLLTATLAHAFDWTLPEGQQPEKLDMEENYGFALRKAVPLKARATPRLQHQAYDAHH